MIRYVGRRANQRKVAKWLSLKSISQNNQNSNQYIVGAYVHIHNKHKVSTTVYVGRRANQRKLPKWLPFENYKSESQIICQGEVCTDDDANANDTNANDNGQSITV